MTSDSTRRSRSSRRSGNCRRLHSARFVSLTAAGAAALGVIFGAYHWLTLVLIALSAGAGAALRRWLAELGGNPFVQPFCAALLAGIVGALVARFQISSVLRLVAVCPCMVLVPGPHFLNGAIDLARARIALGACRIGYASLITLVISVGLLAGLSLGGVELPASVPAATVPLGYDVIAARNRGCRLRHLLRHAVAHAADPHRHWHACARLALAGHCAGRRQRRNRCARRLLRGRRHRDAGCRSAAHAVCSLRLRLGRVVDPRRLYPSAWPAGCSI